MATTATITFTPTNPPKSGEADGLLTISNSGGSAVSITSIRLKVLPLGSSYAVSSFGVFPKTVGASGSLAIPFSIIGYPGSKAYYDHYTQALTLECDMYGTDGLTTATGSLSVSFGGNASPTNAGSQDPAFNASYNAAVEPVLFL